MDQPLDFTNRESGEFVTAQQWCGDNAKDCQEVDSSKVTQKKDTLEMKAAGVWQPVPVGFHVLRNSQGVTSMMSPADFAHQYVVRKDLP